MTKIRVQHTLPVGSSKKLLMAEILLQLRLVVYPVIYMVSYFLGGWPDFFHQQHVHPTELPKKKTPWWLKHLHPLEKNI